MAGNVWDWVDDLYDSNYYKNSPLRNPKNETIGQYRVQRGGSWLNSSINARTYSRGISSPSDRSSDNGIRCAQDATSVSTSASTIAPIVGPESTDTPRPSAVPTLRAGTVLRRGNDNSEMVYVPAGDFLMGTNSNDKYTHDIEKPQRTIYLDAFWIDKYEVTNSLYKKCVSTGKCSAPPNKSSATRNPYYGNSAYDNYPVIYVAWNDADDYCDWANKRLPTEQEWEKATRGTDGRIFPWGNTFDKNLLNSYEGNRGDTTAVGSYPKGASPYGVMDMAGNVREWVADWFEYPKHRAIRGGTWETVNDRTFHRSYSIPEFRYEDLGFRCAQ
jgi:serine/threonine-protein kinase